MTNDTNNSQKRTATQVYAILKANGIELKPENMGDGRTFSIPCTALRTRVALKKAGFILVRGAEGDTNLVFKTH